MIGDLAVEDRWRIDWRRETAAARELFRRYGLAIDPRVPVERLTPVERALLAIVRAFDAAGKWVFGICHGVQILAAAGLIGGKRVTAYENCRWELEAAGATYVKSDQAVRDGRIVTGQTWQSHPEFYRLVFECLGRQP